MKAQPKLELHKVTFYCPESCSGTITATGKKVRKGICAVDSEHLGMTAIVYSRDMTEVIGFWECEDTGGKAVENGVVDFWLPSMEEGQKFIQEHGNKLYIQYVDAKG